MKFKVIRKYKMQEIALKYKNIVLYGAGNYAQKIYRDLTKIDVKMSYCIVTHKGNNCQIDLPLYTLEEKKEDMINENAFIIIAVSELYEQEIEHSLISSSIKNYMCMSKCYRDTRFIDNTLQQDYLDLVVEWYFEKDELQKLEYHQIKNYLLECIFSKKNRNKIVFAIGDLTPRAVKIIKTLKKTGYDVNVLFLPESNIREICKDELFSEDISCKRCFCMEEVVYNMIIEKMGIIHIFSYIDTSFQARNLIQMRGILVPIVYDEYDIINEMYVCNYTTQEKRDAERFCLENADGICNRGYEIEYLIKTKLYKINGKIIQFMDYCSD